MSKYKPEKIFCKRFAWLGIFFVIVALGCLTLTAYADNSKTQYVYGATIELDQKVYTWTDKVFITVVAPDYDLNPQVADSVTVTVSTSLGTLDDYRLDETNVNSGIFVGEVTLTGFDHVVDDKNTKIIPKKSGSGSKDGLLPSSDDDGLKVSFLYANSENIIASALIRWNIGEVQWLDATYTTNSIGTIRVIDPDMNLDPDQIDRFYVRVYSDSDLAGTRVLVSETNTSTGIFEGIVHFSDSRSFENIIHVFPGNVVTGIYTDRTLPSPYTTADYLDIAGTTSINNQLMQHVPATIELDQKVYTWTDKVFITVVAPDYDLNPQVADSVTVTVSTSLGTLDDYRLDETNVNSGVFVGEVTLTGFDHIVDDGGNKPSPKKSGSGPKNGLLPSSNIDGITVFFDYINGIAETGTSPILWNIGEVQWLDATYTTNSIGTIRVIDPDMNLDPDQIDRFYVEVWSDSNNKGTKVEVTETNKNTAIFEGAVFFTANQQSTSSTLYVQKDDTVTSEYKDKTLPAPYSSLDQLGITSTSFISALGPSNVNTNPAITQHSNLTSQQTDYTVNYVIVGVMVAIVVGIATVLMKRKKPTVQPSNPNDDTNIWQ